MSSGFTPATRSHPIWFSPALLMGCLAAPLNMNGFFRCCFRCASSSTVDRRVHHLCRPPRLRFSESLQEADLFQPVLDPKPKQERLSL